MSDDILVVGASLAGYKACKELRTLGFGGAITLLGDESDLPYDRPPLSKGYLAGTSDSEQIALATRDQLAELDVDLVLGSRAVELERSTRRVRLACGDAISYDRLLITTGARARRPAWFRELAGLHLLRSVADAEAIRADLAQGRPPVVVIGGGFIGTEAAAALASVGRSVTLVAEGANVLEPLGPYVSGLLTAMHRERGVQLVTGRTVVEVKGVERVERVELDDGSGIEAPLVLVATGAQPNSEWLGGGTDPVTGAVLADTAGRVDDHVWAAGDVTTSGSGHWFSAVRQARRAARDLLGVEDAAIARLDTELPYFWTDQFDLKVQVVGSVRGATAVPILHEEPYRRVVGLYERAGTVVGVLAAGRPLDLGVARSILRDGDGVDAARARFTSEGATV